MKIIKLITFTMTLISAKAQELPHLFPEWQIPQGIVIVYPDKLPNKREELIPFYDYFIQSLIDNSELKEINLIHKQGLKESLNKKFTNSKVKLICLNNVQDIWIRDFAPIASSENELVKALYSPKYFNLAEKKYALLDDSVGLELAEKLNKKIKHFTFQNQKIIIDGGNLIHNGKGTAITTNRIISDNESISIEQMRLAFKDQLGISNLIIVPVEPGDETGHIDGMMRFINETTVVIASYSENYLEGKIFLDNVANQIEKHFNVIRIKSETPKDQKSEEFPSAFGNYINYLRIGNTIFLPQYGILDKDQDAIKIYEKYFKVIPISKDIAKLSDLGGILNCITWIYFK